MGLGRDRVSDWSGGPGMAALADDTAGDAGGHGEDETVERVPGRDPGAGGDPPLCPGLFRQDSDGATDGGYFLHSCVRNDFDLASEDAGRFSPSYGGPRGQRSLAPPIRPLPNGWGMPLVVIQL